MRTNYVLIDYENVQPTGLALLEREPFKIFVFVGANQAKVNFEIAASMQRLGDKATWIKISGNGPNALDFHIAYYIGRLAHAEPDAYFHIISKDAGFDPLVAHLKDRKIFAHRSRDIADMPIVKVANTKTPPEKMAVVLSNLKQRGASRPRTLKTLSSTINSLFQKALPESELDALLELMKQRGHISVSGTRVAYSLP